MKGSISHLATAAAAALVLTAWTSHARADENSDEPPPVAPSMPPPAAAPIVVSPPRDVITTQEKVPNAGLIGSGVMLFAIPYAGSVIVAASSDRPSDKNLYLPVVGPWMDLAKRGECVGRSCEDEASSQVLLVLNGILQGAGVLQILGGFIFPSTVTVTRTAHVHVTPTAGQRAIGLTAYGVF